MSRNAELLQQLKKDRNRLEERQRITRDREVLQLLEASIQRRTAAIESLEASEATEVVVEAPVVEVAQVPPPKVRTRKVITLVPQWMTTEEINQVTNSEEVVRQRGGLDVSPYLAVGPNQHLYPLTTAMEPYFQPMKPFVVVNNGKEKRLIFQKVVQHMDEAMHTEMECLDELGTAVTLVTKPEETQFYDDGHAVFVWANMVAPYRPRQLPTKSQAAKQSTQLLSLPDIKNVLKEQGIDSDTFQRNTEAQNIRLFRSYLTKLTVHFLEKLKQDELDMIVLENGKDLLRLTVTDVDLARKTVHYVASEGEESYYQLRYNTCYSDEGFEHPVYVWVPRGTSRPLQVPREVRIEEEARPEVVDLTGEDDIGAGAAVAGPAQAGPDEAQDDETMLNEEEMEQIRMQAKKKVEELKAVQAQQLAEIQRGFEQQQRNVEQEMEIAALTELQRRKRTLSNGEMSKEKVPKFQGKRTSQRKAYRKGRAVKRSRRIGRHARK